MPSPFLCFEPPILTFLMLHRFQGESITNFKERVKKKIDIQEKEFEKVSQSYFQGLCVLNRWSDKAQPWCNRQRSIYPYSNMTPRLLGENSKFFKLLLSLTSQKKLRYKENNTK